MQTRKKKFVYFEKSFRFVVSCCIPTSCANRPWAVCPKLLMLRALRHYPNAGPWSTANQSDGSMICPFSIGSKFFWWKPNPVIPLTLSLVVGVFQPARLPSTSPSSVRCTILLPCNHTALPSVIVLPTALASRRSNACLICCVTFLMLYSV